MKMGRQARQFSETGLYHIVFRGVNHCHLFEEDADYEKFLTILKTVKNEFQFDLYAYCLMSNHVHLLIKEINIGDIVGIMKKILTHYAGWFNRKYKRSGSLIANRYKSECVKNDEYLFSLVRYIHQNPVKAGIIEKTEEYQWSSYTDYIKGKSDITDDNFILETLSQDKETAVKAFVNLHELFDDNEYIPSDSKRKTEAQVRREIIKLSDGMEPNHIASLEKNDRNELIAKIKLGGLSIRQIERATGISRGIIAKC